MQEGSIMELVKWFVALLLVMLAVSLTVFLNQIGDENSFKQQVNYEIERKGGLTAEAVTEITNYSQTYYNGRFTVTSDLLNVKVAYGEIVDYQVKGVYDIVIFPIPDQVRVFHGTGVSQVR